MRYQNEVFTNLGVSRKISDGDEYFACKFEGELPKFRYCYLNDCNFEGLAIKEFLNCNLYNCNLNYCDFSNADVSFSTTHLSSPCSAIGCKWDGIRMVLNCSFGQGIDVGDSDDNLLYIALAMIPISQNREDIYKLLSKSTRERLKILLRKPIRKS